MAVLEVRDLKKSFGDFKALDGVSFSVEKGEVVSIIGSSGSGKTTVLRCINQLETADSGYISVDGKVFFDGKKGKISQKEKRSNQLLVGLVFQNFNLFPQYNVLDNVALAARLLAKDKPDYKQNKKAYLAEADERAKAIIERVGLTDKITNYPFELSGGQQQRVSIARALALDPKVLFFDEPTSALDPELTGEVLKVIKGLKNGDCTMVVVTHEMGFARELSDKIIFMSDGVVEEMGTPDEVFTNPKSLKVKAFLSNSLENI